MTPDPTISSELQQIAPTLATASRKMPYALPEDYFTYLSDMVLATVSPPKNATVPPGYFEHFANNMLQLVKQQAVQDELVDVAPTLLSINRQMPYNVPAGYFDNLSAVLPRPAKLISINSKKRWLRIAVAAVLLIGGFSIGQWSNSGRQTITNGNDLATLVADTVTIPQEISLQLASLDASTLEASFMETDQMASHIEAAYLLETDNFEQALQSISTEAISHQLEKISATQKNS